MQNRIPKTLYHYCSSKTLLNIITTKELWLTDVAQSNDFMELKILYKRVVDELYELFFKNPIDLVFRNKTGRAAFVEMMDECQMNIENNVNDGSLTCYVICFSEKGDMLSQWRGYSDNSQGFSIGFATECLYEYTELESSFLELTKIEYKSDKELDEMAKTIAKEIIESLSDLRRFISEEMVLDNNEDDISSLMIFNFIGVMKSIFYDSVRIKHETFKEEREWRLFIKEVDTKSFIKSFNEKSNYGTLNKEAIKAVKERIGFYSTDTQIKTYINLKFEEVLLVCKNNLLREIIIGSKNNTTQKDLELLLDKQGINGTKLMQSKITYR